jgi:Zn-dependent protease
MQAVDAIFYIIVLIMSVVVHEFSHGYTAYLLGDNTAYDQGRLTLNPLKHLDPFGSILLPLMLFFTYPKFIFGWARPVPYNPNNLRNQRVGTLLVASAGIISNIILAVVFGLLIRFAPHFGLPAYTNDPMLLHPFYKIAIIVVTTNLILAIFNLVPIPPLDGSKILFSILPRRFASFERFFERGGSSMLLFSIAILLLFSFVLWPLLDPLLSYIFTLLTGLS